MARRRPDSDEFERIKRYFRPLTAGLVGADQLTDDAFVWTPPAGYELIISSDAMVAGVHFFKDDHPADIAMKLLAVNLSDLAAKGAKPHSYQLSLALPKHWGDSWIAPFSNGLALAQARFGIRLSGGDSVRCDGPAVLSITAIGLAPTGTAKRRSGAQPGDLLVVSGTIGDAALGLDWLQGQMQENLPRPKLLINRLRRPTPRVALAEWVRNHAHAALDISDGLVADCGHLAKASGLTAVIETAGIPLSSVTAQWLTKNPGRWLRILSGGDDYEIAMAVPPDSIGVINTAPVTLTVIGRFTADIGQSVIALESNGSAIEMPSTGWKHA